MSITATVNEPQGQLTLTDLIHASKGLSQSIRSGFPWSPMFMLRDHWVTLAELKELLEQEGRVGMTDPELLRRIEIGRNKRFAAIEYKLLGEYYPKHSSTLVASGQTWPLGYTIHAGGGR